MSTSRPLAVYTDAEDLDPTPGIELLEAHGFRVEYLRSTDAEAIVAGAQEAEALLVGYAEMSADVIAALPNLRIIALASSGVDNVDLDAARAHGVWVANLPPLAAEEVAGHALALALSLLRELPFFADRAAAGDWLSRPAYAPARTSATRLGLVGLGHIGGVTARQAAGLFAEVVGYDPYLPDSPATTQRLEALGVRRVCLEELLATSGVVSLHLPLTDETHHLVDAAALATMPAGSTLVNVSRGGLVDPDALRAAVDSGHLRGAALDVLDVEPPQAGHPLVGHPRILVTPHVGYLSDHTLRDYVRVQAQNVVSFRERGAPDHVALAPSTPEHAAPKDPS
jgi:phosphoglycerate dehydrogenase-like enzyme